MKTNILDKLDLCIVNDDKNTNLILFVALYVLQGYEKNKHLKLLYEIKQLYSSAFDWIFFNFQTVILEYNCKKKKINYFPQISAMDILLKLYAQISMFICAVMAPCNGIIYYTINLTVTTVIHFNSQQINAAKEANVCKFAMNSEVCLDFLIRRLWV